MPVYGLVSLLVAGCCPLGSGSGRGNITTREYSCLVTYLESRQHQVPGPRIYPNDRCSTFCPEPYTTLGRHHLSSSLLTDTTGWWRERQGEFQPRCYCRTLAGEIHASPQNPAQNPYGIQGGMVESRVGSSGPAGWAPGVQSGILVGIQGSRAGSRVGFRGPRRDPGRLGGSTTVELPYTLMTPPWIKAQAKRGRGRLNQIQISGHYN